VSRATAFSAAAPLSASTMAKSCAARLVRRNRRIAGSSSTIRMVVRLFIGLGAKRRRRRQGNGEHRAGAVGAVGGSDGAAHCGEEATADGEAETGSGALPVLRVDAIEFIEDAFEVRRRNARPFVEYAQRHGVA